MTFRILSCVTLFCAMFSTGFAEVKIVPSIDPAKIAPGEAASLVIKVSGEGKLEYPETPRISGIQFSNFSHSTNTNVLNGRVSKSIHFRCTVVAEKTGKHSIEGITIRISGRPYSVPPVNLEVIEGFAPRNTLAFVKLSKDEVYVNEPFLLKFEWLFDKEVQNVNISLPWFPPKGFLAVDPFEGKRFSGEKQQVLPVNAATNAQEVIFRIAQTRYDGQAYTRCRFHRLLTPVKPGEYLFDKSKVLSKIVVGYKKRRRRDSFFDPFEGFGGFGSRRSAVTRQVSATAETVKLKVKPLPLVNRPDDFKGAVGEFSLDVTVSPKFVQVGEPITLTMKVAGDGNFESVSVPSLRSTEGFRLYDAETQTSVEPGEQTYEGEKTFSMPVVPMDEALKEIPEIRFSYFDTKAREYRTISKGPFPVEVLPETKHRGNIGLVTGPEPGQRRLIVKPAAGVFPLRKPSLADFRNRSILFFNTPVFLVLLPVPALLCGISLLIQRRRDLLGSDVRLQRSQQAMKAARQRLQSAKSAAGDVYHEKVASALKGFIADKLNLPSASVDAQSANSILAGARVAESTVEDVVACLEECDQGRFAGDGSSGDRGELLERVNGLLNDLAKAMK